MDKWFTDTVMKVAQAGDLDDAVKTVVACARGLGFDFFAYGIKFPIPIAKPHIEKFNNYPHHWRERYDAQSYLELDPTVKRGGRSCDPIVWDDELFADQAEFWDEARDAGLRFGWSQSFFDANGSSGLLTVARTHEPVEESELVKNERCLRWLVQLTHGELMRRMGSPKAPELAVPLSTREIEALKWAAEGKTAWEVSMIMGLAESTVNFHMRNAAAKLNAPNRTAAAVRAAVMGLLH